MNNKLILKNDFNLTNFIQNNSTSKIIAVNNTILNEVIVSAANTDTIEQQIKNNQISIFNLAESKQISKSYKLFELGLNSSSISNITKAFATINPAECSYFYIKQGELFLRNALFLLKELYGDNATLADLSKLAWDKNGQGRKMVMQFAKMKEYSLDNSAKNEATTSWFLDDYLTGAQGGKTGTKTFEHCSGLRIQLEELSNNVTLFNKFYVNLFFINLICLVQEQNTKDKLTIIFEEIDSFNYLYGILYSEIFPKLFYHNNINIICTINNLSFLDGYAPDIKSLILSTHELIGFDSDDDFSGEIKLRIPPNMHKELSKIAKEQHVSLNQYLTYIVARNMGQ